MLKIRKAKKKDF